MRMVNKSIEIILLKVDSLIVICKEKLSLDSFVVFSFIWWEIVLFFL